MSFPALDIYENFEALLKAHFGESVSLIHKSLFSTTSFGRLYQLTLSNYQKLIIKQGIGQDSKKMPRKMPRKMIEAEGFGLKMLSYAGGIKTPQCFGMIDDECGSLVSSFIETHNNSSSKSSNTFWEYFARDLSTLHQSTQYSTPSENKMPYFGLYKDGAVSHNFIGGTEQDNTIEYSWVQFFAEHRIWKQCEIAEHNGYMSTHDMTRARKLCDTLHRYIDEPSYASLLHGDLWAGNFVCNKNGHAILIDPAVYYGHYEVEIAYTELFGGFHSSFYDAYNEVLVLDKEYHNTRKDIYNLYHLLNHLNLFGSSYRASCKNIISRYT